MFASMHRVSARIGPWPRRLAALFCLLLAAASATSSHPRARSTSVAHGLSTQLHSGEVAVPISVGSANAHVVHPGDLIGLVAAPADAATGTPAEPTGSAAAGAVLVADHVRVLSVAEAPLGLGADATALIEVATNRALAVKIARFASGPLMVIVDEPP